MNPDDLHRLLDGLLEGCLDAEEIERLETELRASEAARQAYCEHVRLHNVMLYRANGVDMDQIISTEKVIKLNSRRHVRIALIAAAAVLMIGLLTRFMFLGNELESVVSLNISPGTEFSMDHHPTSSADKAPGTMEMVPGSRLQVRHGTVELMFASGVHGIVRAPAEITLRHEALLEITRGTGWFKVPAGAEGFQVIGPDFLLTDLGTEFGVRSLPNGGGEVHLFNGKVELLNREGSKDKQTLSSGEARQAGPGGEWNIIELNRDYFLDQLPESEPNSFAKALMIDRYASDTSKHYACVDYTHLGHTDSRAFSINQDGKQLLKLDPMGLHRSVSTQVVHRQARLASGQSYRVDWLTDGRGEGTIAQVLTDDPEGERYKVRLRVHNGNYAIDFHRGAEGQVTWFNRANYVAPETFWIDCPQPGHFVWMRGTAEGERLKIAEISMPAETEPLYIGVQSHRMRAYFDNMAVLSQIPPAESEIEQPQDQ